MLLLWAAWTAGHSPVRDAETAGDEIVNALERYHTDHGVFPGRLNLLMPDYIRALPHTNRVRQWLYTSDAGNFDLGFDIGATESYSYDRRAHNWHRVGS
jgi:hypothetical protein